MEGYMCVAMLTAPVAYRIQSGLVHMDTCSGDQKITTCMPIADFRISLAAGIALLAGWDAESRVIQMRAG